MSRIAQIFSISLLSCCLSTGCENRSCVVGPSELKETEIRGDAIQASIVKGMPLDHVIEKLQLFAMRPIFANARYCIHGYLSNIVKDKVIVLTMKMDQSGELRVEQCDTEPIGDYGGFVPILRSKER